MDNNININLNILSKMKELSKFEIAAIKRTAQNVNAMVTKKTKLKEKIDALQAEYDQIEEAQEQFEVPIRKMTGGYGTEDLIVKVIEDTGKLDKDGKPVKLAKYVLKYPDTILPPAMDGGDGVVDDTEKAPEVEVPAEDAVAIDPTVESPLAPAMEETESYSTNPPSDLPFMN